MNSTSPSCLAIANTPLHIIYIIEFLEKHNVSDTDLVVLIKKTSDKPQIVSIINEHNWRSVKWIFVRSWLANKFISIFELIYSVFHRNSRQYDYGIFGDYGRTILANTICAKYYWLGDGTKLLYQFSDQYIQRNNRYRKQLSFDSLLKAVSRKSFTLPRTPILFSPFHLDRKDNEINHFEWLKRKYKAIKDNEHANLESLAQVFFFGSYFCEVDGEAMMNEDEYVSIIKRIALHYQLKNLAVIYVPHRHESSSKLKRIAQLPNIRIVIFEYPAEYQFIVNNKRPRHIAAFSSTCLFHFHYLKCTDSIASFYIDFSKYGSTQYDRQEIYYNYLRELIGNEHIINVDTLK